MERRGTIGQHAGALGRERIERVRLGRGFALAGRKAPVKAAEGDADGPVS
jgi:hypothetical protein